MFRFLPTPLKGALASVLFGLNTVFWCLLMYPFVLLKVLIPIKPFQRACTAVMIWFGENWITVNSLEMSLLHNFNFDVRGLEGLDRNASYLVSANHQSWVDIVILQKVFNRRIPFLRFFLKSELIWVPFLGIAWWALDFPFMKRYTKSDLKKHPERRGQDLIATRRACDKFKGTSISILNFLEGTRLTPAKHQSQGSPYANLLRPKTGGFAFVINCMGEQFDSVLDVSIVYPEGPVTLWKLLSAQFTDVIVDIRRIPIPKDLLQGDYMEDPAFRRRIQAWVGDLWQEKDRVMSQMKSGTSVPP